VELFVVFAVIDPQFFVVEAGVGVFVGWCEPDGGVFVAAGWDEGVDVGAPGVRVPVAIAVGEVCGVFVAPIVAVIERSLQPASEMTMANPMNVNKLRRRIRLSSKKMYALTSYQARDDCVLKTIMREHVDHNAYGCQGPDEGKDALPLPNYAESIIVWTILLQDLLQDLMPDLVERFCCCLPVSMIF